MFAEYLFFVCLIGEHIEKIIEVIENDRSNAEQVTNELLAQARRVATALDIELSLPRLAVKQKHRSNPPSNNEDEYWRRCIVIPYLDSLTASFKIRFAREKTPAFALSRLHPLYMLKSSIEAVFENSKLFEKHYDLDVSNELKLWYNLWKNKNLSEMELREIEVVELIKQADEFYPSIRKALKILCTLPCTTATVERSFSTLRRVKTWLRSTMGEERLSGLCLMSVHRTFVKEHQQLIEEKIINKFSENPRRLLLA